MDSKRIAENLATVHRSDFTGGSIRGGKVRRARSLLENAMKKTHTYDSGPRDRALSSQWTGAWGGGSEKKLHGGARRSIVGGGKGGMISYVPSPLEAAKRLQQNAVRHMLSRKGGPPKISKSVIEREREIRDSSLEGALEKWESPHRVTNQRKTSERGPPQKWNCRKSRGGGGFLNKPTENPEEKRERVRGLEGDQRKGKDGWGPEKDALMR